MRCILASSVGTDACWVIATADICHRVLLRLAKSQAKACLVILLGHLLFESDTTALFQIRRPSIELAIALPPGPTSLSQIDGAVLLFPYGLSQIVPNSFEYRGAKALVRS